MSGIIDPAARSLIDQMQTAQKALTSYSATITMQGGFSGETKNVRIFLAYQRLNKAYRVYLKVVDDAEKTTQTFVSDGKYCYGIDSAEPKVYTRIQAGKNLDRFVQLVSQSDGGSFSVLPLGMAVGDASNETKDLITIVRKPDEIVDGAARDVVQTVSVDVSQGSANGVATNTRDVSSGTSAIGKMDHLLRRSRLTMKGSGGTATDNQTVTFTFTFADVKANPKLPPSLFVFAPPLGATMTEPMPDSTLGPPLPAAGATVPQQP